MGRFVQVDTWGVYGGNGNVTRTRTRDLPRVLTWFGVVCGVEMRDALNFAEISVLRGSRWKCNLTRGKRACPTTPKHGFVKQHHKIAHNTRGRFRHQI